MLLSLQKIRICVKKGVMQKLLAVSLHMCRIHLRLCLRQAESLDLKVMLSVTWAEQKTMLGRLLRSQPQFR